MMRLITAFPRRSKTQPDCGTAGVRASGSPGPGAGTGKAGAKRGFTLVEVLVALVILGFSAYGFAIMTISSKLWLSKAYYKAKAMEIASTKMEENLAKSYSGIAATSGTKCLGADWEEDLDPDACAAKGGIPYNWNVAVSDPSLKTGAIPYKKIETTVEYLEAGTKRKIGLTNFIPYPYIHVYTENTTFPATSYPFPPTPYNPGGVNDGYTLVSSCVFNFEVKKNIQVSYNLSLRIESGDNIEAMDTIWTRCKLTTATGVVKYAYPQTRTPIISQPVINNWVQFDKIDPGRATLVIEWARQNKNSALIKATQLSLKASNVVVIAVENLD